MSAFHNIQIVLGGECMATFSIPAKITKKEAEHLKYIIDTLADLNYKEQGKV